MVFDRKKNSREDLSFKESDKRNKDKINRHLGKQEQIVRRRYMKSQIQTD